MIIQDTINGLTIVVGDKASPRHCTISMKDNPNEKIELWVQDWKLIKETIDKMFAIVDDVETNKRWK